MNWDFDKDEGWWAVGAHLLLILVFAVPVMMVVEFAMSISFVKTALPVVAGLYVGAPIGDRVFRRLRQRYRARRQPHVGTTSKELD
jgi:uncharacterized membrane protein YfcA